MYEISTKTPSKTTAPSQSGASSLGPLWLVGQPISSPPDLQAGYSEPCAQCSAVDWGVSEEGRFYCRSCHNVIEVIASIIHSVAVCLS